MSVVNDLYVVNITKLLKMYFYQLKNISENILNQT